MIEFYGYKKCQTSRKVEKFLKEKGVEYKFIDITEKPPSKTLLNKVTKSLGLQPVDLINRSSTPYKELKLKEKVKSLKKDEVFKLLIENPKMIKRPVVADSKAGKFSVGFNEEQLQIFL